MSSVVWGLRKALPALRRTTIPDVPILGDPGSFRMAQEPLRAVIIGAGHRSVLYASYSKAHPEELQVVGVADPDPARREKTAQE